MVNEMANSIAARKQYIESWVEKLYDEKYGIKYLFPEEITQFKQYALDMFLDTNLTYEQIADNFGRLVEERQKLYHEKKALEKKEQDIRSMISTIYMENQGLFDRSLEEMQDDYVKTYLNNKDMTIENIRTILLQSVQELKETHVSNVDSIQVEEKVQEDKVIDNEIKPIVLDSFDDQVTIIEKEDTPKQYTKTEQKKQAGFVGLFNIVLSLLGITAFILGAMILNLLLK